MRASLRVYFLLYLCFLVHEGGHALFFWLCGYPVSTFILGVGPGAHLPLFGVDWGIAPIPLGAYVVQEGTPPWWVQVLGSCMGPTASIGVLAFHPLGPVRFALPSMYRFWRQRGWSVASQVPRAWLITILEIVIQDMGAPRSTVDHGVLGRIPVLDALLGWRGWSFWKMSLVLGLGNMLPLPPMDGARALLFLLPQTEGVKLGYGVAVIITLSFLLVLYPMLSIGKYLWAKFRKPATPPTSPEESG